MCSAVTPTPMAEAHPPAAASRPLLYSRIVLEIDKPAFTRILSSLIALKR
jgi:hypothetical protein